MSESRLGMKEPKWKSWSGPRVSLLDFFCTTTETVPLPLLLVTLFPGLRRGIASG